MIRNLKFVVAIFAFLINSVGVLAFDKEEGYNEYDSIYVKILIENNLKNLVIFDKSKFSAVANTLNFKGITTAVSINNHLPLQQTILSIKITAFPYCKIQNNKTIKNKFSNIKFKTVTIIKPFLSLSNLTIENDGFTTCLDFGTDKILIGLNTHFEKSFNPTKISHFTSNFKLYSFNIKEQKLISAKFQISFDKPVIIYGSNKWTNRPPPIVYC